MIVLFCFVMFLPVRYSYVERQEILVRVAEVDDEEKEDLAEVSAGGSGEGERETKFSLFWTESLFSFVASFVLLLSG